MTTEFVWLLIGWATAGPLVWVGFVAYQWWGDRVRRVELDDYTARLRALDQPRPMKVSPIVSDIDDEYLMAHLRKANREGRL